MIIYDPIHFYPVPSNPTQPSIPRMHFLTFNVQKCSDADVFLRLRNALRATLACNCLSLIRPDGSTPAALASLRFHPPEPQTLKKRGVLRLFYLLIFYLLALSNFLSSASFSSLDSSQLCCFHLSILSEV